MSGHNHASGMLDAGGQVARRRRAPARSAEANGSFATATFHHPQGMALAGEKLYVADTENHLIRMLDLRHKKVSTLAGTGKQAAGRGAGGSLRETALNSPWDLAIVNGVLYVAMAGDHQIWAHAFGGDSIHVFAGTGREDVQDGPREEAAFAQPSGLTTDGRSLFVADSEGSAIRRVSLAAPIVVETLAGTSGLEGGQSLFAFGDVDGKGPSARLQHPLGITYASGRLYVADSYNHKIKIIDPATGTAETLLGTGKAAATRSNPPQFAEPGGLSSSPAATTPIADTNNQAVKVADALGRSVQTFEIDGLSPPPDSRADGPTSSRRRGRPLAAICRRCVSPARRHVAFRLFL